MKHEERNIPEMWARNLWRCDQTCGMLTFSQLHNNAHAMQMIHQKYRALISRPFRMQMKWEVSE